MYQIIRLVKLSKSERKHGDMRTAMLLEIVRAQRVTCLTMMNRTTRILVVYHQAITRWSANAHMETAGMVDILKLMEPNIAKILHLDIRNQSQLPFNLSTTSSQAVL